MGSSFKMKKKESPEVYEGGGGGASRFRRSIGFSLFLFILLCAVLQQSGVVSGDDDDEGGSGGVGGAFVNVSGVRSYVLHYNNSEMVNFTYEQLEKWFLNQSQDYKFEPWAYPRAFPFCVTRNQIAQGNAFKDQTKENKLKPRRVAPSSHLYKFERVFHAAELRRKRFYQFEPNLDSTLFNKTFIKDIKISRINTPEPDMVNLRQWAHITIQTEGKMEGLYMQAIAGPLGLPFGEFSLEFPCADDPNPEDMNRIGQLYYCAYRPRASIYHPSAYVGVDTGGRSEFQVHFKWSDLACMETPYIQFLFMVVKKFKTNPKYGVDYAPQISPIFLNTDFDSKDGSPYPYYRAHHDFMFCFLNSPAELQQAYNKINVSLSTKPKADKQYDPIRWTVEKDMTRIQPNEEYDTCVLFDKSNPSAINIKDPSRIDQDENTYECGPGPFRCDKDYSEIAGDITTYRKALVDTEKEVTNCYPCGVPECMVIGFKHEYCGVELQKHPEEDAEPNVITSLNDNTRVINHGVAGMLGFLFFIPIGNFVGRFYKEVMGECLFGNGPWIFIHIVCNLLAVGAVWSSMGHMIPSLADHSSRKSVCKKLYNTTAEFKECMEDHPMSTPHTITGLLALIFLHVVPIFGFIRPSSPKTRFIMSAIHSSLSYLTCILGVISAYFAIAAVGCPDVFVFTTILILLPVIFSFIVMYLDSKSDTSLEVTPPRKKWPVLEQLELESKGPYESCKLTVLAVFLVLMLFTWMMTMINLHRAEPRGDGVVKFTYSFKGAKGPFLANIQGLFGPCKWKA